MFEEGGGVVVWGKEVAVWDGKGDNKEVKREGGGEEESKRISEVVSEKGG